MVFLPGQHVYVKATDTELHDIGVPAILIRGKTFFVVNTTVFGERTKVYTRDNLGNRWWFWNNMLRSSALHTLGRRIGVR